jgi:hypothetical protein
MENIKLTEALKLAQGIVEALIGLDIDDSSDINSILDDMAQGTADFEYSDYRFIRTDVIDVRQQEELASDLYILGCFNADFLAGCTDIDREVIQALQEAESFEALGKLLLPHTKAIQEEYSSIDGYGNHFAHYDGDEHEIGDYYAFKIA